jgi:arylsulfatase A-like enzyme
MELTGYRPDYKSIIIIYADDAGYVDLSCYGMTRIHTPNIDHLAANGLKFTPRSG